MIDATDALTRVHREEWGRIVASLTKRFGDLDIAEEATAEAFAVAVSQWVERGVPPNPGAWLTTTATNRAIDRLRREAKRDEKHEGSRVLFSEEPVNDHGTVADERLRLLFTCCHPALAMESRVALTLRMVGGLSVPEIAHAFLVPETTVAQRITRAKAKIRAAGIPFKVPNEADVSSRLSGVLAVIYLIFNEGYLATGAETDPVRQELIDEAIRLTRVMRSLMNDRGEIVGLLALMLLIDARRAARVSSGGQLVTLDEQDRTVWDRDRIDEGLALVRLRLVSGDSPSRYDLLAAINAVHDSARDASTTDWSQILALYNQLRQLDPSPIVELNRAVAVAELDGPGAALGIVDRLGDALINYHAFHATRADLLRRLGRISEARDAYDRAIELAGNRAEIAFLTTRRNHMEG